MICSNGHHFSRARPYGDSRPCTGNLCRGMSTALTGPGASTVAGAAEGLRLYIDRLNRAGGTNGRAIKLIVQDDQGEPSKEANPRNC